MRLFTSGLDASVRLDKDSGHRSGLAGVGGVVYGANHEEMRGFRRDGS